MNEQLRQSLHDLSDQVEPADLYDRAVRRSRRIARREATVGTFAALAALGVLGSGLWQLPSDDQFNAPPAAALRGSSSAARPELSGRPSITMSPPAGRANLPATAESRPGHRKNQPEPHASTASPQSRTLADLPGQVFYQQSSDKPDVVRLSPGDGSIKTVLAAAPSAVGISPDGARIAYESDGLLLVGHTGDGPAESVATGVATTSQAPAWSPTGDRLLVDATAPAILDVATGTITPLPGDLEAGRQFRWSGDGSKLVYATSYCGLAVTGDGDGTTTSVPVLGDAKAADNPDGLAACRPTSVDATGGRVTVPLATTGETSATGAAADAVVDTVTGNLVRLPVSGTVVGAAFDPDGNLLVRTVRKGKTKLSLFAPDDTLLVQATEPAAVGGLDLIAYTR
ncbi:MAG: hypothetical protein ABW046_05225 [Actinoplanes sp.]